MKKIIIIDCGSGNLGSLYNAIAKIVAKNEVEIVSMADKLPEFVSHIILPGQGAFNQAMGNLQKNPKLINFLQEQVLSKKIPFLGICVGMQILADIGYENGKTAGLGYIAGEVADFKLASSFPKKLKIPHMGWNDIAVKASNQTKFPIENFSGKDFYFVHSFYFACQNEQNVIAKCHYGLDFAAIIAKDNIIATQFHPEKSGQNGLDFLKDFINL